MDRSDFVAVVTGASSGIGETTARKLAGAGYQVILVARRQDRLAEITGEIRAAGGSAEYLVADLAQDQACRDLIDALQARYNRIDLLVNNAGLGWYGFADQMPWEVARTLIAVNATANVQLTLALLPNMKRVGQGHIINISSIAGSLPNQGIALYSASKSLVDAFSTALYRELRGTGVHVSLVKPGPVRTPFFATAAAAVQGRPIPAERLAVGPEQVANRILDLLERPRRIAYVPGILALTSWIEPLFGRLIDQLGPLLLKRPIKANQSSP